MQKKYSFHQTFNKKCFWNSTHVNELIDYKIKQKSVVFCSAKLILYINFYNCYNCQLNYHKCNLPFKTLRNYSHQLV